MPFVGDLLIVYTDEEWSGRAVYETRGEFGYILEAADFALEIKVPVKSKTDFGSIPRFARYWYPTDGPWAPATVIHDIICENKPCGWFLGHAILWQSLCELPRVSWWNRLVITVAVVMFGPKWVYEIIPPKKEIPPGSLQDMPTEKIEPPPPSEPLHDPLVKVDNAAEILPPEEHAPVVSPEEQPLVTPPEDAAK